MKYEHRVIDDLPHRLQAAPPALRPALGREAVKAIGVGEAARLTHAWGLPPRPDFLLHAEHGAVPGAVRVLVERKVVTAAHTGLPLLAWLVAGDPDALRVGQRDPDSERLDQIGWPCVFDARLALRAIDALGRVPALLGDAVRAVRACCDGRPVPAEVEAAVDQAIAACFLSAAAGDVARALALAQGFGARTAAALRVLAAREEADRRLLDADEKTYRAFWHLAVASDAARSGWNAFHAHRGLPSIAADAAASAIQIASELTGRDLAAAAVTWAIELAADGDSRPRAPASAARAVRIVAPESVASVAQEAGRALREAGHRVEELRVRTYPTGDAITRFCDRALDGCDVLFVVLTEGDRSSWVRGELPVQLQLRGWPAKPRVAFLLHGAPAAPAGPIAAIDLGAPADRDGAMARLRSFCR